MKLGYNVLKIADKGKFLAHLERLRPPAILFYQTELDFARQVKALYPDMTVILRNWPDAHLQDQYTPAEWLRLHQDQARGGLMLYTTNESGLSDKLLQWHLELMQACIPLKIQLCLVNPFTGGWDVADMPRLRPLLELAAQHPDLFLIGLHSYAGGVITSGVKGGYPDNAGVEPGKPGGVNLVKRPYPTHDAILNDMKFHVGRQMIIVHYCHAQGIPVPRMALTECGFDYTGDIGAWLDKIARETGHTGGVNGWKTLVEYWRNQYFDMSPEMAFVSQWKWAESALMDNLEFGLLFAYGNDGNWGNYDVSDSAIPAMLEAVKRDTQEAAKIDVLSMQPPAPVVTTPPPAPKPPDEPQPIPDPIPTLDPALDTLVVMPKTDRVSLLNQIADHHLALSNLYRSLARTG